MTQLESQIWHDFAVFRENAMTDLTNRYGAVNAAQILKTLDEELAALERTILLQIARINPQ